MTYGFHFPLASLDEALKSPAQSNLRRPIILVVDDEELIVETLSTILHRSGFTTLTARDGVSALEIARIIPPDLLITDVAMPGMNGVELGVAVTCMIPDCRVILFSAHAQPRDLHEARKAGFDFPLLTKPVHPSVMLSNVHKHLKASAEATERLAMANAERVPFELAS
jgi:CheY-like chemotaxis protein